MATGLTKKNVIIYETPPDQTRILSLREAQKCPNDTNPDSLVTLMMFRDRANLYAT